MKTSVFLATAGSAALLSSSVLAETSQTPVDCTRLVKQVQATAERAKADPIELLRLVDQKVSAHPDCACEIVKAAIVGTGCDNVIVGYIVETAVRAAPEHMRLISQCAIATAPDSLSRVQEVMARLDPSAGEKSESAKSAKSAKGKGIEVKPAQTLPDPLDLPIITVPPIPPVVNPPSGTRTDP